ncbi:MAG: hypothetical protein C5B49_05760, partial [Bdellovibrio sp.]
FRFLAFSWLAAGLPSSSPPDFLRIGSTHPQPLVFPKKLKPARDGRCFGFTSSIPLAHFPPLSGFPTINTLARSRRREQSKKGLNMQQNENTNATSSTVISDHIAIKKMRMIRKMSRKEAAVIFSYSRSSIEKIENGRGKLTPQRVQRFIEGYGFTQNQFMDLKLGRWSDVSPPVSEVKKVRIIEHVEMRRSYKKIITKEVRALASFRKRKGFTQYEASRICGWCQATIGHIEQGRIELTENRIKHIVAAYGFTMRQFYDSVRSEIMRDEVEVECARLIQKLDDNRLLAIKGILEKF